MRIIRMTLSAYRSVKSKPMTQEAIRSDISVKVAASALLSAASAALTVFNIVKQYWFMAGTTLVLVVGFAASAILCGKYKKRNASAIIMAVLCGLIFTIYAVTGENEGFAILWTLLVPPIGMSLMGLHAGTALSAYFQLFLVALFYTPLNQTVAGFYTETFQRRFPVLYLTSFAAAVLLSVQKEFYYQKTESMAYTDALTGLYNRRYYDEMKTRIQQNNEISGMTLICIDLNRLKYTNDNFGHEAGNELIAGAAECMRNSFDDSAVICRTGGDEFTITSFKGTAAVHEQMDKLNQLTKEWKGKMVSGISLSCGVVSAADHPECSLAELEKTADAALYVEKEKYYRQNGIDRRR